LDSWLAAEALKKKKPRTGGSGLLPVVPCGAVMGGNTITVMNFTPVRDKSRDFFTKMVKVNEFKATNWPILVSEGTHNSS
jgi:hypothetical protein